MRPFGLSAVVAAALAAPAVAANPVSIPEGWPGPAGYPVPQPRPAAQVEGAPGFALASGPRTDVLPPFNPMAAPQPAPAPAPATNAGGFPLDPFLQLNVNRPPQVYGEYWARADWLYWHFRSMPLPPLAVTGNPALPNAGIPGGGNLAPLTGSSRDLGMFSGARLTLGEWFDPDGALGAEVSSFIFARRSTSDLFTGSTQPLSVPFLSTGGVPGAFDFSFPNRVAGSLAVGTTSQLFGAEANLLHRWYSRNGVSLDGILGYRYLWLDEKLDIFGRASSAGAVGSFAGQPLPLSGAIFTADSFRANTQFHGGQFGAQLEVRRGMFLVRAYDKYGLGANIQTLRANGQTTATGFGDPRTVAGGLFALPGNVGVHRHTEFSMMNEGGVEAGLQVTSGLSIRVGYNLLWWSNVLRPTGGVSPVVPLAQVPISPTFTPAAAAPQPFAFRTSDFLAHGLVVGAMFEW
jgi:hypothetical protein